MKKIVLAVLIFLLLLTATFPSIPKVSATTTEDLWVSYAPTEDPREPTSDSSSGDYLNTTNQYAKIGSEGVTAEAGVEEGNKPLYVLVFGDEEDRQVWRNFPWDDNYVFRTWDEWASCQLERGDEALVATFGIDIRILGFLEWDTDDSLRSMYSLWDELEADTEQYLGVWYNGESWSGYVDAVIGITAQETPHDPIPIQGLAPTPSILDQGRIFVLLKWYAYWLDDNLAQHEVSHLFCAPDHYEPEPCCAMAGHTHFQWYIWEDGLWIVLNDVPCAYTSYDWCNDCWQIIYNHRYFKRYLFISAGNGGSTSPSPGTYMYDYGPYVKVTAYPSAGFKFKYWILNGVKKYNNPTYVTMEYDYSLKAYFTYTGGGGGGCPILSVYNGLEYVEEGPLDIHAAEDVVVYHELTLMPEEVKKKVYLRLTEPDLPESHSYIDQVKLLAVDGSGETNECHLIGAKHSEDGNVLYELLLSDDVRIDTEPYECIDLTFLAPIGEIDHFTFVIEGYNFKPM